QSSGFVKALRQLHSNAVWPPLPLVAIFAGVYSILDFSVWLIARVAPTPEDVLADPEIISARTMVLVFAAGSYALYRLWRFHPALNHGYAAWLSISPWTAHKPLPLGPTHLAWQDAVVIGLLAGFAKWHAAVSPVL